MFKKQNKSMAFTFHFHFSFYEKKLTKHQGAPSQYLSSRNLTLSCEKFMAYRRIRPPICPLLLLFFSSWCYTLLHTISTYTMAVIAKFCPKRMRPPQSSFRDPFSKESIQISTLPFGLIFFPKTITNGRLRITMLIFRRKKQ